MFCLFFFIDVSICYLVHNMETVFNLCLLLTATGNLI